MNGPGPQFKKNWEILKRLLSSDPWERQAAKDALPREDGRPSGFTIEIKHSENRPQIGEAEAWLRVACPRMHESLPTLETAKLIERTATGFDWKISQAAMVALLIFFSFSNEWHDLCSYFTKNKTRLSERSLKTQADHIRYSGKVKDFWKVQAVIPLAKLP